MGSRNLWADKSIVSIGPLSILNYFNAAKFVFSSTFHGCIFSIRVEKNFAVRIHKPIENKVTSLLADIGLSERGARNLSDLNGVVDDAVDYGPVNQVLAARREQSLKFLRGTLS